MPYCSVVSSHVFVVTGLIPVLVAVIFHCYISSCPVMINNYGKLLSSVLFISGEDCGLMQSRARSRLVVTTN
jgi:hypothetical protein